VNDSFTLVRRGAARGERHDVVFANLRNGPDWISYVVIAQPQASPWGDVVFPLGVKPIGFADSCWRVEVDGQDTGLVLHIRP
jgi:hypothetical protein